MIGAQILNMLVSATLVAGTSSSLPPDEPIHLTFGVYQSDKATVMYRKFTPIIEALQDGLSSQLGGRDIDIQLKIFKTYDEGLGSLVKGDVDFVRFGPASYVLAKEREKNIRLLAMEHKKGKKRFKGVVVVPKASPLKSLDELRGKKFAFGDKNSTIGRYLVQAELLDAGISAKDLNAFKFLGRHDRVATAVGLGDYDAGSIKENTFKKSKNLRALHTFDNVTKPWIARPSLDVDVYMALKKSLVSLKDEKVLKSVKISGFFEATDRDYEFIRAAMKKARNFEK